MKRANLINVAFVICLGCSPVKMSLVEKGDAGEAVENAIADFTSSQIVNKDQNGICNVSVKSLSNGQGNVGDGVCPKEKVVLNKKLVSVEPLMNARAKAGCDFDIRSGVPASQISSVPGKINSGQNYDLTITVSNEKKP